MSSLLYVFVCWDVEMGVWFVLGEHRKRMPEKDIHAITFGPQACVSLPLMKRSLDCVTTFVHHYDSIPRLSSRNLRGRIDMTLTLFWSLF